MSETWWWEDVDRRRFLAGGLKLAGTAALTAPAVGLVGELFGGVLDLSGAVPIGSVPAPRIVTRAEWGADESLRTSRREFAPVTKIIVHHTVTPNGDPDPAERIRAIYKFHTRRRGWDDIGYNFLIDEAGRVYEGRWARDYAPGEIHSGEDGAGRGVVGAHALYHNRGSMGVALLGTFLGDVVPTPAALEGLVTLAAWLCDRHRIDPKGRSLFVNGRGEQVRFDNIEGHRDVRATTCPGNLHPMLPAIRDQVAARLGTGLIGYRILRANGSVANFGGAARSGSLRGRSGVVAFGGPPGFQGFWGVTRGGAVFAMGGLRYFDNARGLDHDGIVDLMPSPNGRGYGLVSRSGGVYAFGSFPFKGSLAGLRRVGEVVAGLVHPSGRGYYLLTDAGAVYAFGGVPFRGAATDERHRGIVHGAVHPGGKGYWLLARDGSVYAYGAARFRGNMHRVRRWSPPARRIVSSFTGDGYLIMDSRGGIYAFGDAPFYGSDSRSGKRALDLAPVIRL